MARGAGGGRPPMGPCGVPWAPLTTAPIARRRHSERQPCGESVLAVRPGAGGHSQSTAKPDT